MWFSKRRFVLILHRGDWTALPGSEGVILVILIQFMSTDLLQISYNDNSNPGSQWTTDSRAERTILFY